MPDDIKLYKILFIVYKSKFRGEIFGEANESWNVLQVF